MKSQRQILRIYIADEIANEESNQYLPPMIRIYKGDYSETHKRENDKDAIEGKKRSAP